MITKEKNIKTLGDHLDKIYGKVGTQTRTNFEVKATAFAISELRKDLNKNIKTPISKHKKTRTQRVFEY